MLYVGVDAHKATSQITVVNEACARAPEQLSRVIPKHGPGKTPQKQPDRSRGKD